MNKIVRGTNVAVGPLVGRSVLVVLAGLAALSHCAPESTEQSDAPLETSQSSLVVHSVSERFTIGTWNIFARPEAPVGDTGTPLGASTHANRVVNALKKNSPDVIVFNELFDDTIRERLVAEFKMSHSHMISSIDFGTNRVIPPAFQDSGLAVFSRFPFKELVEKTPLSSFMIESTDKRVFAPDPSGLLSTSSVFDGTGFDACDLDDCLAAKGAGLVRIALPRNNLNLVLTHMQADNPPFPNIPDTTAPDVRVKQFGQVQELLQNRLPPDAFNYSNATVIVGDLNIPAQLQNGTEYIARAKEPTLAGRQFIDAWRTTSPADPGLTHRGQFPERLDYMLMDTKEIYTPGQPGPVQPVRDGQSCAQWVRTAYGDGPSDHLGVLMDIGPDSAACMPKKASRLVAPGASPVERSDKLPRPGSVMWYRVEEPDTFSVGFRKNSDADRDLRIDVFAETDLSTPLKPIDTVNRGGGICPPQDSATPNLCNYNTQTYFPPNTPVYLRVYDPQGLRTGTFNLAMQRHDCSSSRFICPLRPADRMRAVTPLQSVNYTGYFTFQTDLAVDGAAQDIRVSIDNPAGISLQVSLFRNGVSLGTKVVTKSFSIPRRESSAVTYTLVVQRGNSPAGFSVGWTTNLFYIIGGGALGNPGNQPTLTCWKETAGSGDDEIRMRLYQGANMMQQEFWPGFDKPDSQPFTAVGPFVGPVDVEIAELISEGAEGGVDFPNYVKAPLETLPSTQARRAVDQVFCFNYGQSCGDGEYRMRYDLVHGVR
jgi:hypothetical protein